MFCQCYRKKDAICEKRALKKCMSVRGRKPVLGIFEDLLTDEIIELKILKSKSPELSSENLPCKMNEENDLTLTATGNWCTLFLKFHGFAMTCDKLNNIYR
jgi:hypothetical protein